MVLSDFGATSAPLSRFAARLNDATIGNAVTPTRASRKAAKEHLRLFVGRRYLVRCQDRPRRLAASPRWVVSGLWLNARMWTSGRSQMGERTLPGVIGAGPCADGPQPRCGSTAHRPDLELAMRRRTDGVRRRKDRSQYFLLAGRWPLRWAWAPAARRWPMLPYGHPQRALGQRVG